MSYRPMIPNLHLKSWRKTLGFTLIELMITLVLAAILISALVLTYLSGRAASADAELLSRAQENVRIVSEYLVRDIRNAGYTDEVVTTVGQDGLLRRSFSAIGTIQNGVFVPSGSSGDRLRIRYVGRGHCGENFDTFLLVENEYFVDLDNDDTGFLKCRGRHVPSGLSIDQNTEWDDAGVFSGERVVDLVSGIQSIEFRTISPNSGACDWDYSTIAALESACLGVEVQLGLRGVSGDIRDLTLHAAFRNVILERKNNDIF